MDRLVLSAELPSFPPKNWYHVGRIDPSKNIEQIVETLAKFRLTNNEITLSLYGANSSNKTKSYFESLKLKFATSEYADWVSFKGSISHEILSEVSLEHDAFIHAFWGSLDKALIEAILLKRIVVSSNPEYLQEFYGRKCLKYETGQELTSQLATIYSTSELQNLNEIERKFDIAYKHHRFEDWVIRLVSILKKN